MKKVLCAGLVLGCMLLAGCGGGSAGGRTATATVTKTVSAPAAGSTDDPDSSSADPSETEAQEPKTVRFGTSFMWDDRLEVTVGKPKRFTPSPTANNGDTGMATLAWKVTFKNNSRMRYDLSEFQTSLQSGDQSAKGIIDYDQDIDAMPSVTVLPGRSLSITEGWAVQDPKDLVFTVAIDQSHVQALFVN